MASNNNSAFFAVISARHTVDGHNEYVEEAYCLFPLGTSKAAADEWCNNQVDVCREWYNQNSHLDMDLDDVVMFVREIEVVEL